LQSPQGNSVTLWEGGTLRFHELDHFFQVAFFFAAIQSQIFFMKLPVLTVGLFNSGALVLVLILFTGALYYSRSRMVAIIFLFSFVIPGARASSAIGIQNRVDLFGGRCFNPGVRQRRAHRVLDWQLQARVNGMVGCLLRSQFFTSKGRVIISSDCF
jgi:hypothetical protein